MPAVWLLDTMESFVFYAAQLDQPAVTGTPMILQGFYESGQMWAMLIGIVLGYGFKSFTSYG